MMSISTKAGKRLGERQSNNLETLVWRSDRIGDPANSLA